MKETLYQVHMLPTDKANGGIQLVHSIKDKQLSLADFGTYIDTRIFKSQHLYITSNEEIKEGYYLSNLTHIYQYKEGQQLLGITRYKIIATTNPELLFNKANATNLEHADYGKHSGYPAKIDVPFIEAYVKAYNAGKPIKEVKLEIQNAVLAGSSSEYSFNDSIIPVQVLKLTPEGAIIPILVDRAFTQVFSKEDIEKSFAEGIKAGVAINELPTPRIRFRDWFAKTYPE